MAKVSDDDMALMGRLLGRGEAGEKGAARIAALLDALNESESKLERALYEADDVATLLAKLQAAQDAIAAERDALAVRLEEVTKAAEVISAADSELRRQLADYACRLASCELALSAICDTNGGELFWTRKTLDDLGKEWSLEIDDMGTQGVYYRLVETRGPK